MAREGADAKYKQLFCRKDREGEITLGDIRVDGRTILKGI
jgi:hypothetical protein